MRAGKGVAEVRKAQVIIRGWCFFATFLYLLVLLGILAILTGQGDRPGSQHTWLEVSIGPAVVVVLLVALSLFAWGLSVWSSSLAWLVRASAWLILFAGLVPQVSFSMYLGPLLMMMAPALWPWRMALKQTEVKTTRHSGLGRDTGGL